MNVISCQTDKLVQQRTMAKEKVRSFIVCHIVHFLESYESEIIYGAIL